MWGQSAFLLPEFVDDKEHVIGLLKRVTRVSVETQAIAGAMKADAR
jgi:hypothetical protein